MSKTLNRYITVLNYAYKAFLVLSGAGRGACFSSFTTDISAPVGTTSARISLFFVSNGIAKMFLKTMGG